METELDVIIPIYEARERVKPLLERFEAWQKEIQMPFQLILVEDGSRSTSKEIIVNYHANFPIKYIRLAKNYGQHTATAAGLRLSKAPLIATVDDDLQHDPFELEKMLSTLEKENADLVYGKFLKKEQKWWKSLAGKTVNLLFSLENMDYKDVSSFRLMKREVTHILKLHKGPTYLVDEYLLRSSAKKVTAIVKHHKTKDGASNYETKDLFSFALRLIIFHSSAPLKLIVRLGLIIALACFILGCYFLYRKFVYGSILGYSSLIVSLFFSTGILMVTLGIIGEYIKKIWLEQQGLNEVVISEVKNDE